MKLIKGIMAVVLAGSVWVIPALAADKAYTEGTVWTITMIRVKPGMEDVYWRDILPTRKKIDEEAKKAGLLISSHILAGSNSNKEDFNVVFLDEYKNMAAFDGMEAKYDAILQKVIGTEDKQVQLMVKRSDLREIMGDKLMRELIVK